jgi:hypothetical protein
VIELWQDEPTRRGTVHHNVHHDLRDYDSLHVGLWAEGLCARLRSLSGVATVAKLLGKPYSVAWAADKEVCKAGLDNLLIGDWRCEPHPPEGSLDVNGVIPQCADGQEYYPLVETFLSRDEFIKLMVSIRKSWRPVAGIQARIDELQDKHGPAEGMIGLHIRRTDMEPWLKKDGFYVPNWAWAHLGRSRARKYGKKVYVATCCGTAHSNMRSRLGKRLFVSNGANFDQTVEGDHRQTSVAAALVDVYMLAGCYKLYGTPRSSFTRYAGSLMDDDRFRFVRSITAARRAKTCRGSR